MNDIFKKKLIKSHDKLKSISKEMYILNKNVTTAVKNENK